jgi:hypothetical protein
VYREFEWKVEGIKNESRSYTFASYETTGQVLMEGECSDWRQFLSTELYLPTLDFFYSSLYADFTFIDDADVNRTKQFNATCNNVDSIATLLKGLQKKSTSIVEVDCGAVIWKVFWCDSQPVMCVNCVANCERSDLCPGYSYAVNPCPKESCSSAGDRIIQNIVQLQYSLPQSYPAFIGVTPIEVFSNSESDTHVVVNMSAAGNVYCVVFPTDTFISSTLAIKQFGTMKIVPVGGVTTLYFGTLSPASAYTVYCSTEDYFFNTMPFDESVATATSFISGGQRKLMFTTSVPSLVQYIDDGLSQRFPKLQILRDRHR